MSKNQIIDEALEFKYGGMLREELEFLYDLCAGKKVLELGSMVGMSSYVIAHVAEELHCVDRWSDDFSYLDDNQNNIYKKDWLGQKESVKLLDSFKQNCEKFIDSGKIKMYQGYTQELSCSFEKENFDILFIDADHSGLGVLRDILNYYDVLKPEGDFVFHDFVCDTLFGVTNAIIDASVCGLITPNANYWEPWPDYPQGVTWVPRGLHPALGKPITFSQKPVVKRMPVFKKASQHAGHRGQTTPQMMAELRAAAIKVQGVSHSTALNSYPKNPVDSQTK